MPRLFVPAEQLSGDSVELGGEAYRHLCRVLRSRVGDELVLFDGRGTEIDARVSAIDGRRVTVVLGDRRQVAAAAAAITLVQALPRGERMDLIVQKTTELGVARIVPVIGERSVAHPPASRARRWQTIAEEAARQSGRADVPEILAPTTFSEGLRLCAGCPTRLALWEDERHTTLRSALPGDARGLALLVGTEGGLAPGEVDEARAAGFTPVSLGPRTLRVETAAIVAVALAQAAAGGLD
jgi:16S rRNA (uracil1498-N3)-methyltransferase